MPIKHLAEYAKVVESVLASNLVRYSFNGRSAGSSSLWDALWEEDDYHNGCGGHINDLVESEIDYRVKGSGPKGDFRDWFVERCKRERIKCDSEEAQEKVEQWARDEIYEDYSSFYKDKGKSRRSTFSVPILFDFVDDPDDDFEVARSFNVVKLPQWRLDRLNALYARDPKAHDVMWRYYMARGLMDQVEVLSHDKNSTDFNIGDNDCLICTGCHAVLSKQNCLQFNPEPCSSQVVVCDQCQEPTQLRAAESFKHQLLHGPAYSFPILSKQEIPDTWPRLPGEHYPPKLKLLARLKPMASGKLKHKLDRLFEDNESFRFVAHKEKCGVVEWFYDRKPLNPHEDLEYGLGMLFSANGLVVAGNVADDRGLFDHVPTEDEVLFLEDTLDHLIPEEMRCRVDMY